MVKVSIIIPVYNVQEYIEKCLLSALEQTYKNIEILIIDDCGNDKSMDIVYRILKDHEQNSRIQIIHHENNKGLSEARNSGIKKSTGDYLFFLDSDDYIFPNSIELMAKEVNDTRSSIDFIVGHVTGDHEAPDIKIENKYLIGPEILKTYTQRKWYTQVWNKLYRRDLIINEQLFFQKDLVFEDVIWTFKLICVAQSMAVVNENTYSYNFNSQSLSHGKTPTFVGECYMINFTLMNEFLLSHNQLKNRKLIKKYIDMYRNFILDYYFYKMDLFSDPISFYKRLRRFKSNLSYKVSDLNPQKSYLRNFVFNINFLLPIDWGYQYLLFIFKIRKRLHL